MFSTLRLRSFPLWITAFIIATIFYFLFVQRSTNNSFHAPKVAVIYIFSNTDDQYSDNLLYFINEGVKESDGNVYYIILQQMGKSGHSCMCELGCRDNSRTCLCECPKAFQYLKKIPANVKLVYHLNECYDLGSAGSLIRSKTIDVSFAQYIIIMNSSIRGPFLPSYIPAGYVWTDAFTSRINDKVKLVGPTISCGSSPYPHVQSYLLATDQIGLKILMDEGALDCFKTLADTVKYSEIGGSKAILEHGYTLDTLMLRYQGIDWRDSKNYDCNHRSNPGPQYHYDGITLNPLETLFIKIKQLHADAQWVNVKMGLKYHEWKKNGGENVNKNEFDDLKPDIIARTNSMYKFECFDAATYSNSNYDLKALQLSAKQLYDHYINNGQFEARPGAVFFC